MRGTLHVARRGAVRAAACGAASPSTNTIVLTRLTALIGSDPSSIIHRSTIGRFAAPVASTTPRPSHALTTDPVMVIRL